MLQQVDWPVVTAAVATFITTVFITYKGWSDRKKETSGQNVHVLGASIQDNMSLAQNTEQMNTLTEEIEKLRYDIRANTAALTRATDLMLVRRD